MKNKPSSPSPSIVLRLSSMGDLVLTSGVMLYWHKKYGTKFIIVTRKVFAPLFKNNPAVDRVVELGSNDLKFRSWIKLARKMAARYPDSDLLDLHANLRTFIFKLLWPGPVSTYPKNGFVRRLFLRTKFNKLSQILLRHNVLQRYALARESVPPSAAKLVPQIFLDQAELAAARSKLPFSSDKPLIALHPYATHFSKAWPERHWSELTKMIESASIHWIVIGQSTHNFLKEQAAQSKFGIDLTSKTNLRQTCALLSLCSTLVTSDSGPMHLGTSVGCPVIGIFGPTGPEWGFYPSGSKDRVISKNFRCSPCSLHGKQNCPKNEACLNEISPQDVWDYIIHNI